MAYSINAKDHFNCSLYTGNGGTQSITSVGFQPDWVWTKKRNGTCDPHIFDVIRGATYKVQPADAGANNADANSLTAFTSNGFNVGTNSCQNSNSDTYVSWNLKAGGTASSNSDGSTTSTVSANTTAGFSIVKYTNPGSGSPFTVGHGLGAKPQYIITKNLSASQTWGVWNAGLSFGKYLRLDTNNAEASANLITATSTTTFSTYYDHHSSGNEIIAYCFAPKAGFSAAGKYYGNSNANGQFVYTGFKPGLVIVKDRDSNQWQQFDSKRGTNGAMGFLYPDSTEAETATVPMDILSNGFKFRDTSGARNGSGEQFTYLAVAEAALVGTNNVPANAR
jgi:hypothetical protein